MQVESVLQDALQDHIPPEYIPDFFGGTWQVQCCVWLCIDPNPNPLYIHTVDVSHGWGVCSLGIV